MKRLSFLAFALLVGLPVIACGTEVADDENLNPDDSALASADEDGDEDVGATSDELKAGGCSPAEIKTLQNNCARTCANRGKVSKGILSCTRKPGGGVMIGTPKDGLPACICAAKKK